MAVPAPPAPTTALRLLTLLAEARKRGYSVTADSFAPGHSSMAVPVRRPDEAPVGVLSIAGPSVRMTPARIADLALLLHEAAREIALASVASPLFASSRIVCGENERGAG